MKTKLKSPEATDSKAVSGRMPRLVLHLVLTHHWYDEIAGGRKHIEYREMSDHWKRMIWDRRDKITHVKFSRAYTKTTMEFPVMSIGKGLCLYPGWDDEYFKIYFNTGYASSQQNDQVQGPAGSRAHESQEPSKQPEK